MNDVSTPKRILIFDDDSDFRKLLLLRLSKMFPDAEIEDYDPIAKGVPDTGFDWLRYDVLLLDYFLCIHGVTGLDILRKNRKNPQFPATIMLTGAGNEEIAVRALKSGVSDYIRKETLDKNELKKSILTAHEEHAATRQKANDATLHGHAFNKGLFYQQLEHVEDGSSKRILLLIQLDGHQTLAQAAGIIVRDNIVRHIAKQTFEVFQLGNCFPSITRFSEVSIGILIDDPDSLETLKFNLDGLCKHLQKRPYKFDGKKYRYTVSIGVVPVAIGSLSVDVIIGMADTAMRVATSRKGENSYEICNEAPTESASESSSSVIDAEAAQTGHDIADDDDFIDRESTTVEALAKSVPEVAPETEKVEPDTAPEPEKKPEPVTKPEVTAAPEPEKKPEPEPEPEAKTAPEPEKKPEPVKQKPAAPVAKPKPEAAAVKETKTSPVKDKPAAAPKSDESILDDANLNLAALAIKRSFEEKRVIQIFQPVISLLADEEEETSELYDTSLQLIEQDGSTIDSDEILSRVEDIPAFMKYINRWMIREAIGRSVNSSHDRFGFLMKISDASLADATLFNWLKELLSGLGSTQPGRAITLELSAETFSAERKKAEALMTFLRKSHGFKFALAQIDDIETLKALTNKSSFDLLKISAEMIKQLSEEASGDEEGGTLLASLKNRGLSIVVCDVEDATTLTEVISVGADFAIGEFIGEASAQLEESTNVESFEIS
ncbi:MAG: EAL domain-containing protein [Gammaproteobacteria bacterium]|nr:EAL domain-containing protein [Gammaproteobacteria bacterium]